jgi:NAD-dependent dihydropyrimidine dehydrogenase PreA subunit
VKKPDKSPKHFYFSARFSMKIQRREERAMVKIVIDNHKCTGCGTCKDTCPVGVFEIKDGKSVAVKPDECLVCRACEVQCSEGAIQVVE